MYGYLLSFNKIKIQEFISFVHTKSFISFKFKLEFNYRKISIQLKNFR